MYSIKLRSTANISSCREQLREQHELTQEIGTAITSMPLTEPVDEDELQADLDKLEQEALDEKMLKTGTVPVADSLNSLPSGPNGACMYSHIPLFHAFAFFLNGFLSILHPAPNLLNIRSGKMEAMHISIEKKITNFDFKNSER